MKLYAALLSLSLSLSPSFFPSNYGLAAVFELHVWMRICNPNCTDVSLFCSCHVLAISFWKKINHSRHLQSRGITHKNRFATRNRANWERANWWMCLLTGLIRERFCVLQLAFFHSINNKHEIKKLICEAIFMVLCASQTFTFNSDCQFLHAW